MNGYFLVACVITCSVLCITTFTNGDLKKEAIKNNVAEYKCDPQTGKTMFCWKTNEMAIKADKTVERVWHAFDWSPVEKEYRHNKATCPECNPKMRTKEN